MPRTKQLNFRVTPEESAELRDWAQKRGSDLGSLLRETGLKCARSAAHMQPSSRDFLIFRRKHPTLAAFCAAFRFHRMRAPDAMGHRRSIDEAKYLAISGHINVAYRVGFVLSRFLLLDMLPGNFTIPTEKAAFLMDTQYRTKEEAVDAYYTWRRENDDTRYRSFPLLFDRTYAAEVVACGGTGEYTCPPWPLVCDALMPDQIQEWWREAGEIQAQRAGLSKEDVTQLLELDW